MYRILFLFLLISCCIVKLHAQDSLHIIRSIPIDARMITMDELGNTYAVRNDNTLIRYNNFGDSTGFYRSVLNGDIGMVDATNPLRVLLYYPAFSTAVLLDRMLTQKAEIDLRRKQIMSATAVALASDGNLWVYDPFKAQLLKLDERGEIIRNSNDLRQQISFVPNPSFLLERDRRVYVSDTVQGILIFDQFASYVNTLPLTGIERLQAFDQQLVYRKVNNLYSYDMKLFGEKIFPLPYSQDSIIDAVIGQNTLSVLYKNRLGIYEWPPKK
jgi:hypothetical protein